MSDASSIVAMDREIARILKHPQDAATVLFERYRIAGEFRDAFVAALIGRLCIAETRSPSLAAPVAGESNAEARR